VQSTHHSLPGVSQHSGSCLRNTPLGARWCPWDTFSDLSLIKYNPPESQWGTAATPSVWGISSRTWCWCHGLSRGLAYWSSAAPSTLTWSSLLQLAAHMRKILHLRTSSESGGAAAICGTWVAGEDSPMVDEKKSVSEILRVPRDRRARIVEDVAIESVEALCSLHQIRCQALRPSMGKASTGTSTAASGGTAAASRHGAFRHQ
jgi:hypothetical protein